MVINCYYIDKTHLPVCTFKFIPSAEAANVIQPKFIYMSASFFSPSDRSCPPHCVVDVSLQHKHGRFILEVPLPSRNEKCRFFLRPMLMSVGDLIADLQKEDPGASVSVFSTGMTHHVLGMQLQGNHMLEVLSVWFVRLCVRKLYSSTFSEMP